MQTVFVSAGIVFMAGALIGGGLSAFGVTLPALSSIKRQALLFALGGVLLVLGLYSPAINPKHDPDESRNSTDAQNLNENNTQENATSNTDGGTDQDNSTEVQDNTSTDTGGTMGPLEQGVNRDAHDLSNIGKYAANAYDCSELCRIEKRCVAMTYVISNRTCWLKGVVPPQSPNADMISAVKD
ncbi:PAN domain-containing protein [Sphingomonas alba]|uniref:PAN domain-containing protein n=1 Tax=Sphingomonas alba TaxID=2908208 RepID=A0ABT0RMD3_9SPHN|nr:PAN domain-containing protein [Sphingomonas alba]MCL6683755.1 PAN domain-containing protein [Sphingomonas alba]